MQRGQHPRGDDPTEEAAHQPVGFPGPLLHAAVGHVETARGQAAEPVEEDAEKGIRVHAILKFFWFPRSAWERTVPTLRACE